MNKACFLDRDGVIIEEENYLSDPAKVRLCATVPEALHRLREQGYKLIVVSNQSGIARGYFTIEDLKSVEKRVNELLKDAGIELDGTYYCVHHPKGTVAEYAVDCNCRKPKPGMLLKAAADLQIDVAQSIMIGDKISDLQAGKNAGCTRYGLVRTGHGTEQDFSEFQGKNAVEGPTLLEVVQKCLAL